MNRLGEKIAKKRKDTGMTQEEFAQHLSVTRQTVSRWENGSVMPDIEKIGSIADMLGVSCDYLMRDETEEASAPVPAGAGRLLRGTIGRKVRICFFDGEEDMDLCNTDCTVLKFEGNWMLVGTDTKKGYAEKLIPMASVLSLEIRKETAE